jgi:predicted ATPase
VEEHLEVLERVYGFVQKFDESELPDRALTLRFNFVHVLYQNALYQSLQPTRRTKLCSLVAKSLLARYSTRRSEVAAELALLFEGARDFKSAADYCLLAARNAVRLFANHEAVALARRGLGLLEKLPEDAERASLELALLITLGPPLKDTEGWAAPELRTVYSRANYLREQSAKGRNTSRLSGGYGFSIRRSLTYPLFVVWDSSY